jgi:hypothetical protein
MRARLVICQVEAVSTAILTFTKTNSGGTDFVWFYDMSADGWSLDDRRTPRPPTRSSVQFRRNRQRRISTSVENSGTRSGRWAEGVSQHIPIEWGR